MSVQFGRWNFDGSPVDPSYLQKAGGMLAPYGPDGESLYIKDSVGILFYAFNTTKESRRENQPCLTPSGAVLTWDGRLDNRAELISELKDVLTNEATDVQIVSAAYERWGTGCFANLLGDWALAIWNPGSRSVLLVKDFVGTRHLYYSFEKDKVTWSSILDPLVLLAGKTFALEEEYIAGWLSFFPATHLTPYVGIHSVPPSCFVRLTPKGKTVTKYWDFDPKKRIRYRTDGEYEEHFRQVFGESVRRRLRSDSPVLAELSGGMDSSSIVCMADQILARGEGETPRLDTVSYYNDSEPNWNEKPYFTKVEEKRGRTGCHIDVGGEETLRIEFNNDCFAATPGSGGRPSQAAKQFAACMMEYGNRVVLSGIGGDEVTGGVPTPMPELMNLIARARFKQLVRQLKAWALNKRKPWFQLLFEAMRGFFPIALIGVPEQMRPAPWFSKQFKARHLDTLRGYPTRTNLFGSLPSFQENLVTLAGLQRQLACSAPSPNPLQEKRFPYLDRDLLEFHFAVPREQFVRPGQRRSLMRRALVGIVPNAVLYRNRKAVAVRSLVAGHAYWCSALFESSPHLAADFLGVIQTDCFLEFLKRGCRGKTAPVVSLVRTLGVECWIRSVLPRLTAKNNLRTSSETESALLFGESPHPATPATKEFGWPAEEAKTNLEGR